MPNWVYSTITVVGHEDIVSNLVRQMNQPIVKHFPKGVYNAELKKWEYVDDEQTYSAPVFSFWNIVAPTNLDAYYRKVTNDVIDTKHIKEYFDSGEDWYAWNIRNWGTKWDVAINDNNIHPETWYDRISPNIAEYRIVTAWSPPIEAITSLSAQYPSLSFALEYEEEQGWGGFIMIQNNNVNIVEEWDIPSSHKDFVDRGKDCWACAFYDVEKNLFDDCPVPNVKENNCN